MAMGTALPIKKQAFFEMIRLRMTLLMSKLCSVYACDILCQSKYIYCSLHLQVKMSSKNMGAKLLQGTQNTILEFCSVAGVERIYRKF